MLCNSGKHRGISLIETSIATLLIGMVISSTIGLIGPVMNSTEIAEKQVIARQLIDELVAEISAKPFEDPEGVADLNIKISLADLDDLISLSSIGVDAGERTATRADFDDVDDYHGWVSRPPCTADGVKITELANWGRRVTVRHVSISDFTTVSAERTGAKRIGVQVAFGSTIYAEEQFIRTESWDAIREQE